MRVNRVLAAALLACCPLAAIGADARTPGTVFSDCEDCPAMVVVPAGTFQMGYEGGETDRYEGPVRTITIASPFAVGRYEITNREYRRFVTATQRAAAPTGCRAYNDGRVEAVPGTTWENPAYGRPAADDEPVGCVTWTDATAYAGWLAMRTGQPYRLLSESEWEYAARAGRKGAHAWGDDPDMACSEANVVDASTARARPEMAVAAANCDDGFEMVAPVGQLKPNPFGLYDMTGNVWEWVADCYVMSHFAAAPLDGSAQTASGCDRRGVRGGAWITAISRQRPSFRGRDPVTLTTQIFGLRVARDLPR